MNEYEPIEAASEQDARQKAMKWFPQQANLYAVLDFAVCFGIFDKGNFFVALYGENSLTPLNFTYLRELRIFDEDKELLLVPSDCGFTGRIRRDGKESGEDDKAAEYIMDECQKLWGKIEKDQEKGIAGFQVLASSRGTRILIPAKAKEEDEMAIHVRRYMRLPDVEKGEELVYQNDIRMAGFCPWKGDGDNG